MRPPSDKSNARWLCFGGSFDPIHSGHVVTARVAAQSLGLAGVRLIPAAANPLKSNGPLASAADRLAMCRLAVADDPFFVVDPRELDRPAPSYTIDTVMAIADGSTAKVPWLIGSDLLAGLPRWHRFDELLDRVQFVVMRRAGHPIKVTGLDPRIIPLVDQAIDVPEVEVSATAIRERVRRGESIASLVAPSVKRYIGNHKLYLPV